MIHIDRSSRKHVFDQLKEQLRYALATGAFPVGTRMPSTRALGRQLHLSFHTVRKAYQELAQEGFLESVVGSGFLVRERTARLGEERMESGASIVNETLQRLVGLGLEETEIEYLFQEQLSALEQGRVRPRVLFAASYLEMAEACAKSLSLGPQTLVEGMTLHALGDEQDAEYVFVPHALVREAMDRLPQSDVRGTTVYLSPGALDRIARLRSHETLGIVAQRTDSIPPLMREIQQETGFDGQILGVSIEQGAQPLLQLRGQLNLLVYTPRSRRRLLQLRQDLQPVLTPIDWHVARDSLDPIGQDVPG
jgi:GntR family transcriptional regulator